MAWNPLKRIAQQRTKDAHYNSQVDANLDRLEQAITRSGNAGDMLTALNAQGNSPLVHKNTLFWLVLLGSLATGGLALLIGGWFNTHYDTAAAYSLMLPPAGALLWSLTLYRSGARRQALVTQAQELYEQYKYGFTNNQEQHELSHARILDNFAHAFQRGNHSNEIPRYASGVLDRGPTLPYTLLHYHYVNARTEHYYENGRRKTRTVYDHFDRWGIFVAGLAPLGFALTSSPNRIFPHKWKTSSIEFNRRHHITGASELELARLFQPANVLMFERLLAQDANFNLQVSAQLPVLYWDCEHNLFQRNSTLQDVDSARQLANHLHNLKLPQLERLFEKLLPFLEKMVK